MPKPNAEQTTQQTDALLRALLLLALETQSSEGERTKPEILLSRAGLSPKDIAALLGKKEAAVRKALERAKP